MESKRYLKRLISKTEYALSQTLNLFPLFDTEQFVCQTIPCLKGRNLDSFSLDWSFIARTQSSKTNHFRMGNFLSWYNTGIQVLYTIIIHF